MVAIGVVVAPIAVCGPVAQADQVNWDAVAKCESGGNWSINTGNGAQGGLQIKPATWSANGGVGSPADATRAQQIVVANRILAKQGPGAWPTCMSRIRDQQPQGQQPPGSPQVQQGAVPVGTLTQFVTYLVNQLEVAVPPQPR
ncbi:MAG: transglycosylase family protein [Mycobacterium sp.]